MVIETVSLAILALVLALPTFALVECAYEIGDVRDARRRRTAAMTAKTAVPAGRRA